MFLLVHLAGWRLWQRIMMIMMMNAWLSDTLSRLLPIAAAPACQRSEDRREGSSEEFHPPYLLPPEPSGPQGQLSALLPEAFTKSESVRKLRSPIRCFHLSAVRHFHPRIWHSFIRHSDEVAETHQRTGCSTCYLFDYFVAAFYSGRLFIEFNRKQWRPNVAGIRWKKCLIIALVFFYFLILSCRALSCKNTSLLAQF